MAREAGDESSGSDLEALDEHLARRLHVSIGSGLQETLDAIVSTARGAIAHADFAGLILLERGKLIPKVTLGDPPHVLDVLQQRLGSGPCVEAAARQEVICVDDTRPDPRWPKFADRAVSLGVLSVCCVPLWVSEEVGGTLSLYSAQAFAFSHQNVAQIRLFATHAALALANSRRISHLQRALLNRDLIGQAKGVLMERQRITAEAAFDILSKASQAKNRKLVEIARQLVDTGQLDV